MPSLTLDVDQLSVQKVGFSTNLIYGTNFNLNLNLVKSGIAFSANAADTVAITLYVANQRISSGAVQNLAIVGAPSLQVLGGINFLQVNVSLLTSQMAALVQTPGNSIQCLMHVTYTQSDGEVFNTNDLAAGLSFIIGPNLTLTTAGTSTQAPAGYPNPVNIQVYSPIINGDFSVNQRLNTLSALGSGSNLYTMDKWKIISSSLSARFTIAQSQPTTEATLPWVTPNWSATSAISFTVQTAQTTPAAGDYLYLAQSIESALWTPFLNGPMAVSFLAASNTAQVLSFFIRDSAAAYNYTIAFTLIGDGNWHYYSASILQPPALANWAINSASNASAAQVGFCLLAGATYTSATSSQWNTTGGDLAAIGQGNFMNALTNTLQITQVAISPGMLAQPWGQIAPPNNLEICQRYYQKSYTRLTAPGTASTLSGPLQISTATTTSLAYGSVFFVVPMRATPTPVPYSPSTGATPKVYDITAAADVAVTGFGQVNELGFSTLTASTTLTATHVHEAHWTADVDY